MSQFLHYIFAANIQPTMDAPNIKKTGMGANFF